MDRHRVSGWVKWVRISIDIKWLHSLAGYLKKHSMKIILKEKRYDDLQVGCLPQRGRESTVKTTMTMIVVT